MKQITIYSEISKQVVENIEDYLDGHGLDYQIDLLTPDENKPGGVRKTDPETSKKASFDHAPRSGTKRRHALHAVLRSRQTGVTYENVYEDTGIEGVWKRLAELKEGGWIYVDGQRKIRRTGSLGDVYKPTAKAIAWWDQNYRKGT